MVLRWGCRERTFSKRRKISTTFTETIVKPLQGARPSTSTMKETTDSVSLDDASWSQVTCEGLAVCEWEPRGVSGKEPGYPAATALARSWERPAAILPRAVPVREPWAAPAGERGAGSTCIPTGAHRAWDWCHASPALVLPWWSWERVSKCMGGGESPEHILGWLSQEMPSDWILTFAGEHLFLKIRFSIRKGSECFGSTSSLEGFPVFRLLGVMLLSAVYYRLQKLISLVCCEGRRCTLRSWSSSAKDTTGTHRVWYAGNRYICLG